MKKYNSPEAEWIAYAATDVLMASDENETDKDYVDQENLIITEITTI